MPEAGRDADAWACEQRRVDGWRRSRSARLRHRAERVRPTGSSSEATLTLGWVVVARAVAGNGIVTAYAPSGTLKATQEVPLVSRSRLGRYLQRVCTGQDRRQRGASTARRRHRTASWVYAARRDAHGWRRSRQGLACSSRSRRGADAPVPAGSTLGTRRTVAIPSPQARRAGSDKGATARVLASPPPAAGHCAEACLTSAGQLRLTAWRVISPDLRRIGRPSLGGAAKVWAMTV
jgi:hypothetical protein